MTDEGQEAYAANGYSFTWVNFIIEMNDKLFKTCRDLGLKVTFIHVIPLREQCLDEKEELMTLYSRKSARSTTVTARSQLMTSQILHPQKQA